MSQPVVQLEENPDHPRDIRKLTLTVTMHITDDVLCQIQKIPNNPSNTRPCKGGTSKRGSLNCSH